MKNSPPNLMLDRRGEERYSVTLDVYFQGSDGRFQGTISDVNWSGCFILSGAKVSKGETIHVFLPVRGGVRVQVTGEVTNLTEDIGFGLRFGELNEAQWHALDSLISSGAKP